ncbi:MAG: hypothetical protein GXO91_00435 [FCB group bacterium]|nr:hypothetical protein [FCB group bacterium]
MMLLLGTALQAGSFFSRFYYEMDGGFHLPQADYEKYVDPGISLRIVASYVDPDYPFIRYDAGFQYLQFRREEWWEEDFWTSVRVTNSEQSYGLTIGPRLTSPTSKGALRPYIGLKGGLFLFTETIKWDWSGNSGLWCWLWGDCEEDSDESYTEVLDARLHFGWMLELGTNIFIHRRFGVDVGVQYTMIPGIRRPVTVIDEDDQTIGYISRKLDATYMSFYIGTSIPLFTD